MGKGKSNFNTAAKTLTKGELLTRYPRICRMTKRMDAAIINGASLADLLHVIMSDKNMAISGAEFRYLVNEYFVPRNQQELADVDPSLIKEYICQIHGWHASVDPRCDMCEVAIDEEEPVEAAEAVDPPWHPDAFT
jgi:hypothetical protein